MLNKIQGKEKEFLSDLMAHYVDGQGLGAMPKSDLDALIVHLFIKHSGAQKVDVFELSETFKIKESRVKTLVETGWIKFSQKDEQSVWMEILHSLSKVAIELESLEKGQIRFKLDNPAHFRYFQKQIRLLESTATYSPSSEQVVAQFEAFNKAIDRVYFHVLKKDPAAVDPIKAIYKKIRNDIIGSERFESYRNGPKKDGTLGTILTRASELASIGALVLDVFGGASGAASATIHAAKAVTKSQLQR